MKQTKFHINLPRVLFIVLLFCIIFLLIYAIFSYRAIEESRTEGFSEAEAFVLQHSNITNIDDISYFQAEEGFFTFLGRDSANEKYYIFLRDDGVFATDDLYVVANKGLVATEELEQEVLARCSDCTLIHSNPAMIDELPLWELTYIDDTNRYVIEYKYLQNGKTFETLRLTRKYKKD